MEDNDKPSSSTHTETCAPEIYIDKQNDSSEHEDPLMKTVQGITSSASGWLSSWLQTAKDTSIQTYELVRTDLNEFKDVLTQETINAASATTNVLKENVPKVESSFASGWMRSVSGTVGKMLAVEDTTVDESDNEEILAVTKNHRVMPFTDRAHARLYVIRNDPCTYLNEPDGASELFDDWLDHFSIEDYSKKIAEVIANLPEVRTIFNALVPSEVSNVVFWQRYFYKLHQFHLDEARRQTFLKMNAPSTETTSDMPQWEKECFAECEERDLPVVIDDDAVQSSVTERLVEPAVEANDKRPGSPNADTTDEIARALLEATVDEVSNVMPAAVVERKMSDSEQTQSSGNSGDFVIASTAEIEQSRSAVTPTPVAEVKTEKTELSRRSSTDQGEWVDWDE